MGCWRNCPSTATHGAVKQTTRTVSNWMRPLTVMVRWAWQQVHLPLQEGRTIWIRWPVLLRWARQQVHSPLQEGETIWIPWRPPKTFQKPMNRMLKTMCQHHFHLNSVETFTNFARTGFERIGCWGKCPNTASLKLEEDLHKFCKKKDSKVWGAEEIVPAPLLFEYHEDLLRMLTVIVVRVRCRLVRCTVNCRWGLAS